MDTCACASAASDVRNNLLRNLLLGLVAIVMLFSVSCATVGRDFPVDRVSDIRIGETTQKEIRAIFGPPWRVGIEDGQRTWTYGKYRYRAFRAASTQDLVIRFNERDVVASYTFNTTEHQE
jgi:hypothetical protein